MKTDMSNKREQIIALRKCGLPSNRQRDYWKKEERQMLQDMFYEGEGISDMAVTFNRSEVAIINQINSMQLYEKVRNPRQKKNDCRCSQCNKADCEKYAETHSK